MIPKTLSFDEFIPLALRTESAIPEEGVDLDLDLLMLLLDMQVTVGTLLDYTKKGIFYNNYSKFDDSQQDLFLRLLTMSSLAETVAKDASRRVKVTPDGLNFRLLHGILGSATEGSELVEVLLGHLENPQNPVDVTNVSEEIADDDWYKAIICDELAIDRGVALARVIEKLSIRYPDKFSALNAVNRNLQEERAKLEGK